MELDFLYPSEGIHRRWDSGYRITSTAATWDQAAFVLSVPRRKPADETQETLRTSAFPSTHVKVDYLVNHFPFAIPTFPLEYLNFFYGDCAGEMGKESLYCIYLLWSNCLINCQSFSCNAADLILTTHLYDRERAFTCNFAASREAKILSWKLTGHGIWSSCMLNFFLLPPSHSICYEHLCTVFQLWKKIMS